MKTALDNKPSVVQIEYDPERIEAIRFYLGERNATLEKELVEAMDVIFKKNVPPQVREYINRRNPSIPKPDKSE